MAWGLGEAVAVASISVPAGAVMFAAIMKLVPKNHGNSKLCSEHHHLAKSVDDLCADFKEGMEALHEKTNNVSRDVSYIRGLIEKERK